MIIIPSINSITSETGTRGWVEARYGLLALTTTGTTPIALKVRVYSYTFRVYTRSYEIPRENSAAKIK